ncbi:MAG: hypothetical protein ACI9MR_004538 [Myxococcota bacterium]|jgi:hypothetical protein
MAFEHEKQAARYLLGAIEDGMVSTHAAAHAFRGRGPCLGALHL